MKKCGAGVLDSVLVASHELQGSSSSNASAALSIASRRTALADPTECSKVEHAIFVRESAAKCRAQEDIHRVAHKFCGSLGVID